MQPDRLVVWTALVEGRDCYWAGFLTYRNEPMDKSEEEVSEYDS